MRGLALLALTLVSACAPASVFRRGPRPDPNVEAQFQRAMMHLEPGRSAASLDTAAALLDAYIAHAGYTVRRPEATVLRRLTADAIQLSKVAAALQQERAENRAKAGEAPVAAAARPDTDSLKEIQRLKDELAAANAELERIRKRLATQKP